MPGGLHPPLDVIATWTPNYKNPETHGQGVVILVIVLQVITWLVVFMRLWARFYLTKNRGIDDALIIFSMLPLTAMAVSIILAIDRWGFDKHVWDLLPNELVWARKSTLLIEELFMVSITATKISILLFYRRLAAGTVTNRFTYYIYAAITFVVIYFIIFFINILNVCRPFSSYWMQADYQWLYSNDNMSKFHCEDEAAALISSAAISSVQDFIACGLPIVLLWRLSMPKRQKIALAVIFAVGVFVCISSVIRIAYIVRVYYYTYDMTWESLPAWIWLAIEGHIAVICASAPALKIFFKEVLGSTSSHQSGSGLTDQINPQTVGGSKEKGSSGSMKKKDMWHISVDGENDNVEAQLDASVDGSDHSH